MECCVWTVGSVMGGGHPAFAWICRTRPFLGVGSPGIRLAIPTLAGRGVHGGSSTTVYRGATCFHGTQERADNDNDLGVKLTASIVLLGSYYSCHEDRTARRRL